MSSEPNRHLGKKILYAFIIALCVLVILVNTFGIVGVWMVKRPLTDAAVAVLQVVEGTAKTVQQSSVKVDQVAEKFQAAVLQVENASLQIGQNVTDKGLVLSLLPEEQEQKVIETAASIRETFLGVKDALSNAVQLYRSIDSIPFVNLPDPGEDQVKKLESSIEQTQAMAESLRSSVGDFRSGVADKIDVVTTAANTLNEEIQVIRDQISQLNEKMASLEALASRLQHSIVAVLTIIAVVLSLLLAFLIFTQVEVIRLYITRWRLLDKPDDNPQ